MSKVVRSVLGIVGIALVVLAIQYAKAMAGGVPFEPNWVEVVLLGVVGGLAGAFGPDAAQRRQNRKDLADKFRK